jgi:glycosyltransferase involved in cell wall biosynthesis
MEDRMLVSIIVNNYNYARYLGVAIDSALAQTWRPLEVVVVDDGSTDDSWSVIERYGARIRAIRQPNGGQGAAYNSGFAASHGEWVLFLDSDDLLDSDAIVRLMALQAPDVSKIQGYLRHIDSEGKLLGSALPYLMHDGDVTPIARRFRQYAGPPASGNLYRRSAIEPYLPLHAPSWRRSADTVPALLSAFHGRLATVRGAIGCYRLHTHVNRRFGLLGNVSRSFADALAQSDERRRSAALWGSRCSAITWSKEWLALPWDWRTRALSWRLQRAEHPYPGDTRRSIWRGFNESLAEWPGYSTLERGVQRAWMGFMLLAPRRWVAAFASSNASGGARTGFRRLRGGAI